MAGNESKLVYNEWKASQNTDRKQIVTEGQGYNALA